MADDVSARKAALRRELKRLDHRMDCRVNCAKCRRTRGINDELAMIDFSERTTDKPDTSC